MLNRRKLLGTAGAASLLVPAAPYIARPQILRMSGGPVGFFPGQPGNPVGHMATPAMPSLGTSAWSGSFLNGSLGLGSPTNLNAFANTVYAGTIPNGTPSNPTVIAFIDFNADQLSSGTSLASNLITSNGLALGAGSPASVLVHDVVFIGCRFQGRNVLNTNVDCFSQGAKNIKFLYCSITPLLSISPTPLFPGVWPSASAGSGYLWTNTVASDAVYGIPFQNSATFGISPGMFGSTAGQAIVIDHCDIWGCADGINLASGTDGAVICTDNWVHDLRNPNPPGWSAIVTYPPNVSFVDVRGVNRLYQAQGAAGNTNIDPTVDGGTTIGGPAGTYWACLANNLPPSDHQNGIGYPSANPNAPANITIRHNTIASLGNVEGMTVQTQAGNPIDRWTIVNNYISGFDRPFGFFDTTTATYTNITFTDNILSNAIWWGFGNFTNRDVSATFTLSNGHNNLWRRNTITVYPGSSDTYFAAYIASNAATFAANRSPYALPTDSVSATDWAS